MVMASVRPKIAARFESARSQEVLLVPQRRLGGTNCKDQCFRMIALFDMILDKDRMWRLGQRVRDLCTLLLVFQVLVTWWLRKEYKGRSLKEENGH